MGGESIAVQDRPRLLAPLAAGEVVLLEAPGGYGKTTLADQLAAAWELVVVRARFAEPTTVGAAVADLRRSARRAGLFDLVEAMEPRAGAPPAEALDAFVGLLAAQSTRVTVVLDDVHRLDPEASGALAEALRDLPAGCRIVVAGRELGAFARWLARPGAQRRGLDDLRMDRDEVAAMLGTGPSAALVDDVARATTGWGAAVALAVARVAADPTWSPVAAGGARALLAELVAELVEDEPSLALLTHLPLIDPQVCELAGGPGLVAAARASGLLATGPGRWSELPDPIAEVLAGGPAPGDGARAAIARHYRSHGESAAAIALLSRADDAAPLVAFLADLHWSELEELGARVVRSTFAAVDDHAVAEHPRVLVSAAQAVELADPALRAELLARAARLVGSGDSVGPPGDGGALLRAVSAEQARDAVAATDLERVPTLVAEAQWGAGPGEELVRARALTALARSEVFACTPESLRLGAEHYAEAAAVFRAAGETRWLAETLARRGYTALFMAGQLAAGAEQMREALALLPTGDFTRGFWLTNYADVLDVLGDGTEAQAAVAEALDIGRRRQDHTLVGMAAWTASWLATRRGDADGCRAAVAEAEAELDRWARPGQVVELLASTAECFARLGDEAASADYCARARRAGDEVGYDAPVELAASRHAALFGDAAGAVEDLERLDTAAGVVPSTRPARLVLRALAEARLGCPDRSREVLADARSTAAAMGVPDLLERFEAEALDRLRPLLATDDGRPGGPPAPVDGAVPGPVPVSVRLLGGFAATAGGRDCTPHPGHPSTLVKLLAVGGPLTVDMAIDGLWPEADPSTGRSRLRNLLNRLKDRSGELVVRDADGLRLSPAAQTDIAVFEQRGDAALAASADQRVGLARHAIALYAGELLPGDVYEDWAAAPRERLKRRFLALVDLVADDAVARGDAEEAVRLLDLGIAAEPLDEGRYALLCQVLVARGRLGSAREVAARAVSTLGEIGVEVSPDVARLVRG